MKKLITPINSTSKINLKVMKKYEKVYKYKIIIKENNF